jgi:hypothetical protein
MAASSFGAALHVALLAGWGVMLRCRVTLMFGFWSFHCLCRVLDEGLARRHTLVKSLKAAQKEQLSLLFLRGCIY